MPRLENWTIMSRVDLHGNPYQRLVGDVYGHPKANDETGKYTDGNNIMTNKLIDLDFKKRTATTQSGAVYELGFRSMVDCI